MAANDKVKVLKPKGRPRTTISGVEREHLLDEFERSGQKGTHFARSAGINYLTFMSWHRRRRKAGTGLLSRSNGWHSPKSSVLLGSSLVEAVLTSGLSIESIPPEDKGEGMLQLNLPGGAQFIIWTPHQIPLAAQLINALGASRSEAAQG